VGGVLSGGEKGTEETMLEIRKCSAVRSWQGFGTGSDGAAATMTARFSSVLTRESADAARCGSRVRVPFRPTTSEPRSCSCIATNKTEPSSL
jgi:hypothetical protein